MDRASELTLDPLLVTVLAEARSHADRSLALAEREAEALVAAAQEEARRIADRAHASGTEAADEESVVRISQARAVARTCVLEAQREALVRLRTEVLHMLADVAGSAVGAAVADRLAAVARSQLGAEALIEQAPGGGIIATAGRLRVDYGFSTLADRCIRDLGARIEELWR
jgi:vacuolar-type H+-ATPase subunit E/Vma4